MHDTTIGFLLAPPDGHRRPRPPRCRDLAAEPDVEETGSTLEENARIKAAALAAAIGVPAIADDTGLEVDALDGAPGIYAARYAGPDATYADNVAKLLREMEGVTTRRCARRGSRRSRSPAGPTAPSSWPAARSRV